MCLGGSGPRVKTPQKAIGVVTACCVLFNMSKEDHIQEVYQHVPEDDDNVPPHDEVDDVLGIAVRNEIVRNFFD